MNQVCENCKWTGTLIHPQTYICHRYPPNARNQTCWNQPEVARNGYCGEFKPKEADEGGKRNE